MRTVVAALPAPAVSGPAPTSPLLAAHGDEDSRASSYRLAAAVRGLIGDASEMAASGLVDAAVVLATRYLSFDAVDSAWPDRDRVVLAPGQASLITPLNQLIAESSAPANWPDRACDTLLGGFAGGLAEAVGAAMAERVLAARFGRSLVNHRIWCLAGPSDLAGGVCHEAASLAGQSRLERLTVLWSAAPAAIDDTLKRFAAYGWAVRRVDAADHAALGGALGAASRSRRPTLLACRRAAERVSEAWRHGLGDFVDDAWRGAGSRGAAARRRWLKRLAHHPRRVEFERSQAGLLPATLGETLARLREALAGVRETMPTCVAAARVLEALLPAVPELVVADGGSATATQASARWFRAGMREMGMTVAMDGLALHGGLLPVVRNSCNGGEVWHQAAWRAGQLGLRQLHVLVCDDDAARESAVDKLAGLRALPHLLVLNPADAVETAECWAIALRAGGPSLMVLHGEPRPPLRAEPGVRGCAQGGYLVAEAIGPRRATLIAAGPAVAMALEARARLAAERVSVAVVSLPCWSLLATADADAREALLGEATRFGIEAGGGFGWERWLGAQGCFIGTALGLEAMLARVREHLAAQSAPPPATAHQED